jgi:formylglycine-generating enzyme required for sulfatase activity
MAHFISLGERNMKLSVMLWILAGCLLVGTRALGQSAATMPTTAPVGMVVVAGGVFVMGSGEGLPEEAPPHRVDLPGYFVDVYEVTVGEYARFVKETGAAAPAGWKGGMPAAGMERMPITNITWFDAMRYAIWAGKRLPTEAEWEKAARGTDGRRFPWGNADEEKNRNLEGSRKLEAVDSRPGGASPVGAMQMSGNAWEWTASWYEGYPGTLHRAVQFGRKYKVVRGGGAEYYYGLPNPGTTTARARALAYGGHDFIGFRCVKDIDPAKAPYDAKKVLAEAEGLLNAALREPVRLAYEDEYEGYVKGGRIPLKVVGGAGQKGIVKVGVPFPKGRLRDVGSLRIINTAGQDRPAQTSMLASWQDGSARWMLVEFVGEAGESCWLDFGGRKGGEATGSGLVLAEKGSGVAIDTGAAVLEIDRASLLKQITRQGQVALGAMTVRVEAVEDSADLRPLAAEKLEIEERGPVHACVRLEGAMGRGSVVSPFRYDMRIEATAGSPRVRVMLTLTHKAKRTALVHVKKASVEFALPSLRRETVMGADGGVVRVEGGELAVLQQDDDLRYEILRDGTKMGEGTRAAGWMASGGGEGWVVLGVRHFWQNAPKRLMAGPQSVGVGLWAGKEPFDWEGGLAKTHEIVVDFGASRPEKVELEPLRASMPPAWACGTEAMGAPMLPRGREALERFPYWEMFRESGMHEWVRGMPAGFRDYGDAYLGGPYKGKNAYANLEYDVHYNFLMEYLRTGQTWYVDAAEAMTRHQGDIDTDHWTGQPWKHSPGHTTTEAELGHVFFRGMVMHYFVTGERRSLDVAREIGDWVAATLEKGQGTGNERQIGWSLYALTGLYDATRDPKYLHAAETLCNRLLAGQAETGQFANIRWDNRISFFNGIAMNGMIGVYELNGDEKLAEGIMKVAGRTIGFYPEYACRTLNAFIWAARRTNDPRYLDAIERTWELSQEYLPEAVTTDTHAWHFRQFAAKQRLFPLFGKAPEIQPDPATWRGVRVERPEVEVYLQPVKNGAAPLMVVREGHAEGRGELLDSAGKRLAAFDLNDSQRVFEASALSLPLSGGMCRLRLSSAKAKAWQIHYDAASRLTVYDPTGEQIPHLYPRAYGYLQEGTKQIVVKLEAMGEGFHSATLYDPQGRPVKTVRHFVDFEDPGRYELELKMESKEPLTAEGGFWSLEVYKAKVLSVKGILPYWASEPGQLFHPEREGGRTR